MDELRTILNANLNRSASVPPIQITIRSDTQEGEEVPTTLCGWVPTPLEPPGPLAAILWKINAEFRAGTPQVRRTILREEILKLQVRIDKELRGHRWSRKKITEQLAAQQNADASPPQDTRELDDALAYLYEVQFVIVDEANKKIRWVPEDPRTWTAARPVWGLGLGSRAIYHRKNEESVANYLSQWLAERIEAKWSVAWPEADGKLDELKKRLTDLGGSLGPRLEKPKKDDYVAAVGRVEALRHISKEFSGNASIYSDETMLA